MKVNKITPQNFCAVRYSKNEYSTNAFERYAKNPAYSAYTIVLNKIDECTGDKIINAKIYKDKDGDILMLHCKQDISTYTRCYTLKKNRNKDELTNRIINSFPVIRDCILDSKAEN